MKIFVTAFRAIPTKLYMNCSFYIRIYPLFCLFSVALLLTACKAHIDKRITKVEFAKSLCFLPCDAVAVSIDSSLNFEYYIDSSYIKHRKSRAYYTGKVSRVFWNELTEKLEQMDYSNLDTTKKIFPSDLRHRELKVYFNHRSIRVETVDGDDSQEGKLHHWLDSAYKHVKLKLAKDTIHFGTTVQLDPRIKHFDTR